MLRNISFLLFVLIGCGPAKPSETDPVNDTIPDSLLVREYPVEVPLQDTTANVQHADIVADTTYTEFVPDNSPTTPQLDPTVAYVYKKSGLDLYEVNREFRIEKVIGHLDYKSKVRLLNPLTNDMSLTVDGMKGYYALAQIDGGRMAYVFTGWLVGLPVPDEGTYIKNYLLEKIHVEKAVKQGVHSPDSSAVVHYSFEQGITMTDERQHEHDGLIINIPGMSIQQAWLLGRYFMPGMDIYLKKMPTDSATVRVNEKVFYKVSTKNGKVWSISHEDDSGCFSHESFTDNGTYIQIVTSIGC